MSKAWYVFLGGSDPTDANNYHKISVKHSCLCGHKICAILAEDAGIKPASPLSDRLITYIGNGICTGQLQPELPFHAKKYVYLKSL